MKNIVFLSLPKVETAYPPGALANLSSIAKDNEYQVNIFDYNLDLLDNLSEQEWNEIEAWNTMAISGISINLEKKLQDIFLQGLAEHIDHNTKFVCFSVFSYFSNRIAIKVLNWYKHSIYDVPSVVGGSGISTDTSPANKEIFGDYLLQKQLCDFVVFGEGEICFDHILKGQYDYPGINHNNPEQIMDLSQLPVPTYEYFDMARYQNKKILITSSRGCVRHCTFCDIDLTWPKFRYRKAEHVVDEIKRHFYEYNITEFEFTDSLINGSISNFDRFNELLIEAKIKDPSLAPIRYQGQFICRPKTQQKDYSYELMHKAGCSMLITGIESFSNSVRDHMKKKFSDNDIEYHFQQCARWSIPNVVLMVVGYPTETHEDHLHTLRCLHKYKTYADMGVIFMIRWGLTMHLYEHTPIMSMIDDLGISLEQNVKLDSVYSWVSNKNPTNTLQERIRRRLEIHELCVELGYPMPRVLEELLMLKNLAEKSQSIKIKKTIDILS